MSLHTEPILGLQYVDDGDGQHNGLVWGDYYRTFLKRISSVTQIGVLSMALTAPPGSPAEGDRYIVAASPTGDWTGQANKLAIYRDAVWTFETPKAGWLVWNAADPSKLKAWSGSAYVDVGGAVGTQNLLFTPDNTYDIGASGASRARNIYAAAGMYSPFVKAGPGDNGTWIPLVTQAHASQTGNLFEARDSAGNWIYKIKPDGTFETKSTTNDYNRIRDSSGNTRITLYSTGIIDMEPAPATSGATMQDSPNLIINSKYWNGAGSTSEGFYFAVDRTSATAGGYNLRVWDEDYNTPVWVANGGDNGMFAIGPTSITSADSATLGQFHVRSRDVARPTATFRAIASQTADILQWQNSAGTVLSKVDSAGSFGINTSAITAGYKLDVNGNAYIRGVFVCSQASTGPVYSQIENTDNTNANARAGIALSVGGASAGDPYIYYLVTGNTGWVSGIDNSDGDKYKISIGSTLGTNDALAITTTGIISAGTTSTTAKFNFFNVATGVTAASYGQAVEGDFTCTADVTELSACISTLRVKGAVNLTNNSKGYSAHSYNAFNSNTATVALMPALRIDARNISTGTLTAIKGIQIDPVQNSGGGSIGTSYGLHIMSHTAATTNWAIMTEGSMRSRFGGSVIVGAAALATNATDGFLYLPSMAGTPTGTPVSQTGTVPTVYDTSANKLWIYNGAWRSVTLT